MKPSSQVMTHALASQLTLPLEGALHTRPQAPQCITERVRSVSHPLAAIPSQSPRPVAHAKAHVPERHTAVAPGAAGHTRPHAPQFITSLARGVSQPLRPLPSQLPKLAAHTIVQVPALHPAVALVAAAQRRLHIPQWSGLVLRSTSHPSLTTPLQLP
jgi:hypothetical protein